MLFETQPVSNVRIASDGSRHATEAALFAHEQDLQAERMIEELLELHLPVATSSDEEAQRAEFLMATTHFLVRSVGLRVLQDKLNTFYASASEASSETSVHVRTH